MKPSPLWQISVAIHPEAEEPVSDLLQDIFGNPASIYTHADTQATTASVFCERRGGWSRAKEAALRAGLLNISACGLNIGPGTIRVKQVLREDWAESWKKHFKPIEISPTLLIKPSWSRRRPRRNQQVVVLDPGLSFGTGQHATTSFCLRQLADARRTGTAQSFLDVGTGSGILAIAAVKLGYAPVEALDHDPESVRVTTANAAQNGVTGKLKLTRRDVTTLPLPTARRFDVVCANLICDLLLAEAPRIVHRVGPKGRLVLAGILATQFKLVKSAYRAHGFRLAAEQQEGEWHSGAFVRR